MRILGVNNEAIEPVAQRIKDRLATFPGVSDIEDNPLPGRMEMQAGDKGGASTLGISLPVGGCPCHFCRGTPATDVACARI